MKKSTGGTSDRKTAAGDVKSTTQKTRKDVRFVSYIKNIPSNGKSGLHKLLSPQTVKERSFWCMIKPVRRSQPKRSTKIG